MNNCKVSILIPLYNAEKYIAETIQSAINQTWPNKEIIIVDDGSTDRSYEIAKSYESGNIKVYKNKGKGACAARNMAFELSVGNYIQYLDADDLLSPNKIEEQLKVIAKLGNDTIASCSWARFCNNIQDAKLKIRKIDKNYANPIECLIDSWNGGEMTAQHCWLTPRNTLLKAGKWNEMLDANQDGEFFCRVLLNAKYIKFASTIVYYRITPNSITKQLSPKKYESILISYELYINHIKEKKILVQKMKTALASNFSSFYLFTFPNCPDLLVKAEDNVKQLGFKKFPIKGGIIFRIISLIFGFKRTVKLRHNIRKFIYGKNKKN
jgi:glycosyltransferase involved in cell wall biosynthesis